MVGGGWRGVWARGRVCGEGAARDALSRDYAAGTLGLRVTWGLARRGGGKDLTCDGGGVARETGGEIAVCRARTQALK